jgi:hypothetical protein
MASTLDAIREKIAALSASLEAKLSADVLGIFGPILGGVEHRVRKAVESLPTHRDKLAVGGMLSRWTGSS